MHRQPLLDALSRYAEQTPCEAPVAQRIGRLVTAHPACFERTCQPGHVTGSAWVVSADGRHHLLLHHRKLGMWLQPGGHADGDPDTLAVARREAEEESGLSELQLMAEDNPPTPFDLDVHTIPTRRGANGEIIEPAHEHHDVRYLFRATGDQTLTVSDESHAVRWATADEVRALTADPSVLRMLDKAVALLNHGS